MRSTVTKYQEFDSPQAYFVADVAITRLLPEINGWRQHLKAKITVPWLLLLVLLLMVFLLLLLLLWWFSFLVLPF